MQVKFKTTAYIGATSKEERIALLEAVVAELSANEIREWAASSDMVEHLKGGLKND